MRLTSHSSITTLLREENVEELALALAELTPFEIADLIEIKSSSEQSLIFKALPQELAIKTFDFLPTQTQRHVLKQLPAKQAASFLKTLSPDDRTSFLQDLPKQVIDELVKLLPQDERIETMTLLNFPKGSVGRLMTTDYISVKMDWTIEQALDHIRAYGHDSETINVIYVVDDNDKLLDDIKLKDLLFVPRNSTIQSLSNKQFVTLSVYDNDEEAINTFKQYNRIALPVIDEKGILVGIVTIDDILRLANQEATEDIQKIGGMEALNEPYMKAPFMELMHKRAGWLILLFFGEAFTATAMSYFQDEIARAVVLTLFLPLIISSGGNAGSQASTLVVRALALGEVTLRDWWKIVKRELFSGMALGVILGVIGFFRVALWGAWSHAYGEHWIMIAFTVCFALIGVVLMGTLSGAIFPLLLRKVGLDPATSSAPFVATIVDVTGVVMYFLIALIILKGSLL